jgi:NADH dehydrogenase
MAHPHVVIVGGGFGGLYAARVLADQPVRVTLVDRQNYHLFQPLLYQVATAALNPSDIAYPIRHALRLQRNTDVILAEVRGIDTGGRRVLLDDGAVDYDYLLLATGATHSYFNHPEWAKFAPGLKGIEDAIEIRRRMLLAYEAAEREPDEARRAALMTFVIVGGGPTGVELAGAFAEIARQALVGDFRHIDPATARVLLLEHAARVLPPYDEGLSERARSQLLGLGAEVHTGALVTAIDAHGVSYEVRDGTNASPRTERVAARTVVWAAGVAASPVGRSLGAPLDRAGRVCVEPDLSVPGHPEIFVAGDLAATRFVERPATPKTAVEAPTRWVPGVAPAAIQGGTHAAVNMLRRIAGKPTLPFAYLDKGSLATIGRSRGVAEFGRVKLHGYIAWLAWLLIHVYFLVGFRNRVLVVLGWAWNYATHRRGARLITGDAPPALDAPPTSSAAPRAPGSSTHG